MAVISLRSYNHEIEGMIDNGQLDEAVAHCRHILTTFPKHIATYRLLGKSHLEQQRISDATDIFQRVLTALPDDFVSNVGMSIIREDENNLDAAIWHMELAYEAQPANIAIQDELRRLYGRRDGVQPPKVRLTRGALARMYAKGGLYDQSIAELRAAISEDPNRPDLQVLLAQMFYQTSQRVEAVDTCVNILKKIPLCLEANRILAVSLPDVEGSDAVKNYRQIVISMDPYYAFAEPDAISSDQVPENAVNIERLEWKSGIQIGEAPNQPDWATSLGISMEKPSEENIPDWLKSAEAPPPGEKDEKATPTVSPFIWDTQEVEKIITDTSKPEGDIPDWMKDAGWKPATGKATPPPEEIKPQGPTANVPQSNDLEKADIPEWLQGIAPEGVLGAEQQETQPKEDNISNPWLEPHQPGPTDSIIQWLEEKKPEAPTTPHPQEENLGLVPDEEVPDWLKDIEVPQTKPTSEEKPAPSTPAFTSEPSAFTQETVASESVEPRVETPSIENLVEPAVEAQSTQAETIIPPEIAESKEPPAVIADEIPDWLKEIATELPSAGAFVSSAEKSTEEGPQVTEPEQKTEQAPTFEEVTIEELPLVPEEAAALTLSKTTEELPKGEMPASTEQQPTAEVPSITEAVPTGEIPVTTEALPEVEVPASTVEIPSAVEKAISEEIPTSGLPSAEEEIPLQAPSEAAEALPVAESPAVTKELPSAEATSISEEVPSPEIPVFAEELPAKEIPTIESEPPQAEQPVSAEGELPPAKPASEGESEAFAWLEGLVAEQAAKGGELISPTPEGEITPPEWVKLENEPPTGETAELELRPAAETPAVPAEEIPEWIKGLGEEPEVKPTPAPPEAPAAPVETAPSGSSETEIPQAEELPAWLLELEQPEPEKETSGTPAEALEWKSDELPTWLKEITESAESEEVIPAVKVPAPEAAAVPAEVSSENAEEIIPPTEPTQEAQPEPQPETGPWVPEVEEPTHPVPAIPVEAEAQPTPVIEELTTKSAEIAPAGPPEQAALPVEMVSDVKDVTLNEARDAISQGHPSQAAGFYTDLIKQKYRLDEIIKDLQEALYRYPVDVNMWVALGDAHYRSENLQEALDAYTKAEELVR